MAKSNSGMLVFIWAVLSAAVGIAAFAAVLDARAKPQPLSAVGVLDNFRIVAFTAPGEPVLRNSPGGPYTFYIDRRYRKSSEKMLEKSLPQHGSIKIRLFHEDPAARKQEVLLNLREGDTNYFSIYSVDEDKVTPLRYSELTGRDISAGVRTGSGAFVIVFLSGIAAMTTVRTVSSKRARTGAASPA